MQAEDVAQRIKELQIDKKFKICGLSTKEAVETAVSAGATTSVLSLHLVKDR